MRCFAIMAGMLSLGSTAFGATVFPGVHWETRDPAQVRVQAALLDQLAEQLGGRGCVVKDGYMIKTWGDVAQRGDWYSSAKPVLSTLLFFAIDEGRVKSVDEPIARLGWDLKPKDQGITFRHLGAMTSGYARPEGPGKAWSYNDYAIQLYQKTLFDKAFQGDPKVVSEDPRRLGGLGLEDGLSFNGKRRISASVRDFARIDWFWLNNGRWNGKQLLPKRYFDLYRKPQTPKDLPQTAKAKTDDYLGVGTYGGESDHFSEDGPGTYGFNWWFNDTGRTHPNALTWPDAPKDTFMSIGARGNSTAVIPSLHVVLVCAEGDWDGPGAGNPKGKMNRALKLLTQACSPVSRRASAARTSAR